MRAAKSGVRGVYWRPDPHGRERHPETKASGHWWIRWQCPFGHVHREKIGPKSVATNRIDARRTDRPCPAHTVPAARVLLVDTVRDYLRDHQHKRSHKEDQRHGAFWIERLGGRALDEISRADIRRIRAQRLGDVSPATVNRQLAFLRTVFNVNIEDGRVTLANPLAGRGTRKMLLQEPSGRVRYLGDDEEVRLMAVLAPWEQDRVRVLCETGLRKSEFLGLRWRDVDFKGNVLTIPRSKHGETRHLPLTSRVRAILSTLPRPLDSTSLVFPNREGHRDLRWAAKRFPAAVKQAGLVDFRLHDTRHTFASRLAIAGVDLLTIKELGGWKTLSMVQRYAHLSTPHLQASIERLVPRSGVAPGVAPTERQERGGSSNSAV